MHITLDSGGYSIAAAAAAAAATWSEEWLE